MLIINKKMYNTIEKILKQTPFNKDNVKTDSRKVAPGDIFVAIKGTRYDGHDYILGALKKGAKLVLCEEEIAGLSDDDRKKVIRVEDTKKTLALIAKHVFNDPSNSLKVYGITGTNGKTTTAFLIDKILNTAGTDSGFITTVFTKTAGEEVTRSSMTTPDSVTLNSLLRDMAANGKKAAVMEVSSHALDQERVCGIEFASAVFTNITPEHLDYHGSMEKYLKDKSRIFENLKANSIAVLNQDDQSVRSIKSAITGRVVTFGIKERADIIARNIKLSSDGTSFDLIIDNAGSLHVETKLIGEHNVYNILASVAALVDSGIDLSVFEKALNEAVSVPGRLELVTDKTPFRIFVDYAHTPDALENVLKCLKDLSENRLMCVFGCGGDRDKTKRPVMGEIASRICDKVIITSDNPRTEDPRQIINQIEKGVLKGADYSIILDRKKAIFEAIDKAKEKDIIVIAGKGHEDYQIIGDKVLEFDDKKVALEILKELKYI